MFADSLLESAPHSEHRSAWAKLTSALLQSFALAVILAIPLFHIERLQIIPPLPSIRMTPMPPAVEQAQPAARAYSATPTIERLLVQPKHIPSTIERITDRSQVPVPSSAGVPCDANCRAGIPIANILSSGPTTVAVQPPRPPVHPLRVSEMKLGDLVHKVIPEYPMVAKQLHIQGVVVLMALIGKDGRVEHLQVISGPPLLVQPAMRAVEQWQYRPYMLNHEPVEVQTQVTVNFVLNRE